MKHIRRIIMVLIWLIIWQIASVMTGLELLLASPVAVLRTLAGMLVSEQFYVTLAHSILNIGSGLLVGIIIGVLLGICSGRYRVISEFIEIPLQLMKSLPVAAFIILLLMWFGSRNVSRIISAMVVIPMITTGVTDGISNTDTGLIQMARVYNMSLYNRFRYIYLTGVYPYLKSQLKIALGMCFKAGISAEIIGLVSDTIGTSMYYAKMYLLSSELFAWSIVVIAVSFIIEKIILKLFDVVYRAIQGNLLSTKKRMWLR